MLGYALMLPVVAMVEVALAMIVDRFGFPCCTVDRFVAAFLP
jgi:hypothetical protein